jgi:hypothetical protein
MLFVPNTEEYRNAMLCKKLGIDHISQIVAQRDVPFSELEGVLRGVMDGKEEYNLVNINHSSNVLYITGFIFQHHYRYSPCSLNLRYSRADEVDYLDAEIINERNDITTRIKMPQPRLSITKKEKPIRLVGRTSEGRVEPGSLVTLSCARGWPPYSLNVTLHTFNRGAFDLERGFLFQAYKLAKTPDVPSES